jgi:hypothetical protein
VPLTGPVEAIVVEIDTGVPTRAITLLPETPPVWVKVAGNRYVTGTVTWRPIEVELEKVPLVPVTMTE